MRPLIADLWQRNRLVLLTFSAALVLTLFFAVRLVLFALHGMGPRPGPGPIAGWVTQCWLWCRTAARG